MILNPPTTLQAPALWTELFLFTTRLLLFLRASETLRLRMNWTGIRPIFFLACHWILAASYRPTHISADGDWRNRYCWQTGINIGLQVRESVASRRSDKWVEQHPNHQLRPLPSDLSKPEGYFDRNFSVRMSTVIAVRRAFIDDMPARSRPVIAEKIRGSTYLWCVLQFWNPVFAAVLKLFSTTSSPADIFSEIAGNTTHLGTCL